ncbi:MAG: phage tail protein [Synergistaceae bacterium]|nr:phage tail protein [Synergistaceae bacterium]
MIGSLGEYEFEVSEQNVKNFTDLSFSNSVNYAEHKVIGKKGVLEFTGLNASTASLTIELDESQGVNVSECITDLYTAMNAHEALAFTLGGDVMGGGLWVIESLGEKYTRIAANGTVMHAALDLKLKEYLEDEAE